MTELESKRQEKMVAWLEEHLSCIVIKQSTNRGYGRTGWPDLLVLPPREEHPACLERTGAHFVETKTPAGELSAMQAHRIGQLRAKGYPCAILQSVGELREAWLDHFGANNHFVWWEAY